MEKPSAFVDDFRCGEGSFEFTAATFVFFGMRFAEAVRKFDVLLASVAMEEVNGHSASF